MGEEDGRKVTVFSLKKSLNDLRAEVGELKKAVEEMKSVKNERKLDSPPAAKLETLRQQHVPGTETIVQAIHEILDDTFEVVFEAGEAGTYSVAILVPPKYDNRTDADKQMYPHDRRVVVVPIVGGLPLVKEYASRVKANIQSYNPMFKR